MMTLRTDSPVFAYIGIAACGCVRAIVVDDGLYPKDVAKTVAEFIKSGRTVERVDLKDGIARLEPHCPHRTLA